ncbi:MAG: TraB/GumN family protein [Oscillospiraceae bacterium]|nr:TraB/GumN family protein [Oscillospiraceae bacterium]
MKKILSLVLCLSLLLGMTACGGGEPTTPTTEPTVPPTTTEPAPDAAELYAQAAEKIRSAEAMLINYTLDKTTTIGQDTFMESEKVSLSLATAADGTVSAASTRNLTWGEDYYSDFREYYGEGGFYVTLDGMNQTCEMTGDEFLFRYLPGVILSPELYTNVAFLDDTTIEFSGANALEPWLAAEGRTLVEASGTAVLNAAGILDDCTYHAVYTQNGATHSVDITLRTMTGSVTASLPADADSYVPAESADALLTYERAIGLTLQAKEASSFSSETILIEAGATTLATQMTMNTYGAGKELMAKFDSEVVLLDLSTGETAYSVTQEELFKNGTYTVRTDGGPAQPNRSVTAEMIESSRMSQLADTMPLTTDLSGMTLEDLGAVSLLEFSLSEELAEYYTTYLVGMIYQDPNLLNDLATDYRTEEAGGFLGIDNATGLPTQLGLRYIGIHTIDGTECQLVYDVSQSFAFADGSAYHEITDENPPVDAPENPATPLLYHVTGADGQEMWLFGTIHVGDSRMAYLPQELVDALTAADSLAVEFDDTAFTEALEEDEELVALVQEHYFYTDGTKTADHVSDELLYQHAIDLLKATGGYNSSMELCKPILISQAIENAYLALARNLSPNRGADAQLMDMARDMGKEILDVESAEAQIAMLTGYSEPLQELLLTEALEIDAAEYQQEVLALYELWCSGDEAALIAYLTEEADLSELTEDELALYEEYTYAMSTERNAGMLEVAKGYLEGDSVVFYAVGLAHLLAQDGLVNTLRDAGYTVELVTYN